MEYLVIGPSSMGLFGFVGSLKRHEEKLKNIKEISGSSAGAVLGACLALEIPLDDVLDKFMNLDIADLAKYKLRTFFRNFGLVDMEPVRKAIVGGIPGYRARIRPIVSRITIHWPSFYNVVTGKTLALPNLIALQHIPLSPAGVIAKRPAPIALPNSCAAEWRMAPDAVFSPYASVRYFTPHMVHSQYNLL